jgi:ribosome biogenesis GTPase
LKGTVYKSTGSWYEVKNELGEMLSCRLKGKIRLDETNSTNPIAVGDIVELETDQDDTQIVSVHKRKNYIVRESPKHKHAKHIVASNLDQAFLIVTIASPRTSSGFIDRFLVVAAAYDVPVVIVFNKLDLLNEKELAKQKELINIYKKIGYETLSISCLDEKDIKKVKTKLKGKTTLLSGHSGVGKSTLLNALNPNLDLRVGDISAKHDKGTHTTTFAEMIEVDDAKTLIIDTPGIKEFGIMGFELEEISAHFLEMRALVNECQFNNCMHIDEPKCAVKLAVTKGEIDAGRYDNYVKIVEDYKENYNYWERKK